MNEEMIALILQVAAGGLIFATLTILAMEAWTLNPGGLLRRFKRYPRVKLQDHDPHQ